MREGFSVYQNRIHQLVKSRACFPFEWESLNVSAGAYKKFYDNGSYKPFYGDTVVFPLSKDTCLSLGKLQDEIYDCAGELLSERLPKETFHITLHDLCSGEDPESVAHLMEAHIKVTPQLVESVRNHGQIRLRSVGIVSMVGSSLVMLFEPQTEVDHERLQNIYGIIDEMQPLSYPLTLHCTLAYYKPGSYTPEQWNKVLWKICDLNKQDGIEAVLDCAELEYQHFSSMKDYRKVETWGLSGKE